MHMALVNLWFSVLLREERGLVFFAIITTLDTRLVAKKPLLTGLAGDDNNIRNPRQQLRLSLFMSMPLSTSNGRICPSRFL